MIRHERQERMMNELAERGVLSVAEAVRLFGISAATARRDFKDLARRNLARRIRGGIKLVRTPGPGDMLPFHLREVLHAAEKQAVARRAAMLLRPGQAVIIDGGTTTFFLSRHLPAFPLRVITNSLRLAAALEERRGDRTGLEIYISGGYLLPLSGLLVGPNALASLSQYHGRWAFLSAGGVTAEGISNTNELVVEAERMMMERADRTAILVDHSKIGRRAMCHVCGLDGIDVLITDRRPERDAFRHALEEAGVELVVVDAGGGASAEG